MSNKRSSYCWNDSITSSPNHKWLKDFPIKGKVLQKIGTNPDLGLMFFFYWEFAQPFSVQDLMWGIRRVRQFQQKLDHISVINIYLYLSESLSVDSCMVYPSKFDLNELVTPYWSSLALNISSALHPLDSLAPSRSSDTSCSPRMSWSCNIFFWDHS